MDVFTACLERGFPSFTARTAPEGYRAKNPNTSQEIAKLNRNTERKNRTKPKGPHRWT
jgi:hypothetical protein